MKVHHFTVSALFEKYRLDKYLAEKCPSLTRSHIKNLILQGSVSVERRIITTPNFKIKADQEIDLLIPEAAEAEPEPEDLPLDIIFEDEDFLVINKAAGMVVHPAYGNANGTLVNALLYHCGNKLSGIRGVKMPGIVHRLDKDTSGLMVVAKSDVAHQGLTQQFNERTLFRKYLALVYGIPSPAEGEIRGNIGRHPAHRQKMALLQRGGKEALTHYQVVEAFSVRASLVECRLHSGRTHQIRVHMASIGYPLLGDPLYGKPPRWVNQEDFTDLREYLKDHQQQALHAYQLQLRHPLTGKEMKFESPLPLYIMTLMSLLKHKP